MKLILFLILVSSQAMAQSIRPGNWKAKSIFKVSGIPLPENEQTECVSPADAKDAKTTIMKELKSDGCKLLTWKVKGSVIEASLECENDQLDAKGRLHGHFTSKSYDLEGEAEGTYQKMIPSTATLKLTGQWIGDCKK